MADVTLDPQNSNSKELFGQGVRAYVLQDYDTAVRAFSKVSELLAAEHGNDIHDSLGDVYLYYGKSLLELSRKESGPLGDGVLKNVDEGSESEEIESEDGEDNNESNKPEDDAKVNEDQEEKTEPTKDTPKPDEQSEDNKDETNKEEASSSTEKKEGEENEELTDLQVAWEVLELAKRIFTNRGDDGKKNLAETMIVLGEISLESGNFPSAIEDITQGLEIQKKLFGNDSRTIAETYYKLGGALSTNGQIDEAIESFKASYEYLKNKVASLEKEEEHKAANAEEIEELNNLIPEIEEKIADMKNLKVEVAKKMTVSVEEAAPSTNGTAEASSSKQANDISHLVKRKRKSDDDNKDENPAKKPSP